MDFFRKLNIRLFLSLTLVVMVLNISIDPPDLLANLDEDFALEENVNINEMESISELVLEKVLDIDNVIPETDDEEADTYLKKVELANPKFAVSYFTPLLEIISFVETHSFVPVFVEQTSLGILSPPPKS